MPPLAFDQRLHLRRDVCHIGRRTQQNAVRLLHLLDVRVAHIVFLRAATVFFLRTFAARQASVNRCPAHFDQFGPDPFVLQFLHHVAQQNRRISALACAAIQRDNLQSLSYHLFSLPFFLE
jgi:hypothetical protein